MRAAMGSLGARVGSAALALQLLLVAAAAVRGVQAGDVVLVGLSNR